MNVAQAIRDTVRHLGGDNAPRNRVAAAASATAETLSFEFDLGSLDQGAVVELPSGEKAFVWSSDETAKTVQVSRGEDGTTPAPVAAGDVVRVSPRFFTGDVRQALLQELDDLEAEGLFAFRETQVAFDALDGTYDVSGVADLITPYLLRYRSGGRTEEHDDFEVLQGRLRPFAAPPASTATLLYRGSFSDFDSDDDDLEVVSGVAESAHDLLPLGAAIRLLASREAVRLDERSKQAARSDEAIPPGSLLSLSRQLQITRQLRLSRELDRQYRRWPLRQR